MNETSPLSPRHLSPHSLSFVLVPFWWIPSLIWLWRRGATENLVERVFMVDSVVRWLSQRRMLISQPRLRLIWLAAVTPSSRSQSTPHLFPPDHCAHASLLSLCLFFFFNSFFLFHTVPPLHYQGFACTQTRGLHCYSYSALKIYYCTDELWLL